MKFLVLPRCLPRPSCFWIDFTYIHCTKMTDVSVSPTTLSSRPSCFWIDFTYMQYVEMYFPWSCGRFPLANTERSVLLASVRNMTSAVLVINEIIQAKGFYVPLTYWVMIIAVISVSHKIMFLN
jgi:hypothetical protein